LKILVPVDGSANSLHAVKHIVRTHRSRDPVQIHLLNVQSPLPRYITRFLSRDQVAAYHRDEGERALKQATALLDSAQISHQHHIKAGDKVEIITRFAKLHYCDAIVMGSGRKSAFMRFLQSSVTNRVMEQSQVPVQIIPGEQPSALERIMVSTGIGIGLTLWLLIDE
jgi:nucleotide-binding universal stress UspA family protein